MYEVKIYARDKNGNRGPLISRSLYPTQEQAKKAKAALIHLITNQRKYSKHWSLKNATVV